MRHTYTRGSSNRRLFSLVFFCFFFNDTATTEIYTLSLHDALPIFGGGNVEWGIFLNAEATPRASGRSEEHTSELQSQSNLVCRLLLEKKTNKHRINNQSLTAALHRATSTTAPSVSLCRRPQVAFVT